jgi:hypothetical protein
MADENVNPVADAPAKKVRMLRVRFERGYFPLDGSPKIDAETSADLPLDEAKGVISKGFATRDDPLPE